MTQVLDIQDTLWHIADYTPMSDLGNEDENGHATNVLGTQVSDIPCRLREADSRDVDSAKSFGMQRVDYVMTVKAELGAAKKGQFKNITLQDNTTSIFSGKLTIEHITTRKLLDTPIFSLCYCLKVS